MKLSDFRLWPRSRTSRPSRAGGAPLAEGTSGEPAETAAHTKSNDSARPGNFRSLPGGTPPRAVSSLAGGSAFDHSVSGLPPGTLGRQPPAAARGSTSRPLIPPTHYEIEEPPREIQAHAHPGAAQEITKEPPATQGSHTSTSQEGDTREEPGAAAPGGNDTTGRKSFFKSAGKLASRLGKKLKPGSLQINAFGFYVKSDVPGKTRKQQPGQATNKILDSDTVVSHPNHEIPIFTGDARMTKAAQKLSRLPVSEGAHELIGARPASATEKLASATKSLLGSKPAETPYVSPLESMKDRAGLESLIQTLFPSEEHSTSRTAVADLCALLRTTERTQDSELPFESAALLAHALATATSGSPERALKIARQLATLGLPLDLKGESKPATYSRLAPSDQNALWETAYLLSRSGAGMDALTSLMPKEEPPPTTSEETRFAARKTEAFRTFLQASDALCQERNIWKPEELVAALNHPKAEKTWRSDTTKSTESVPYQALRAAEKLYRNPDAFKTLATDPRDPAGLTRSEKNAYFAWNQGYRGEDMEGLIEKSQEQLHKYVTKWIPRAEKRSQGFFAHPLLHLARPLGKKTTPYAALAGGVHGGNLKTPLMERAVFDAVMTKAISALRNECAEILAQEHDPFKKGKIALILGSLEHWEAQARATKARPTDCTFDPAQVRELAYSHLDRRERAAIHIIPKTSFSLAQLAKWGDEVRKEWPERAAPPAPSEELKSNMKEAHRILKQHPATATKMLGFKKSPLAAVGLAIEGCAESLSSSERAAFDKALHAGMDALMDDCTHLLEFEKSKPLQEPRKRATLAVMLGQLEDWKEQCSSGRRPTECSTNPARALELAEAHLSESDHPHLPDNLPALPLSLESLSRWDSVLSTGWFAQRAPDAPFDKLLREAKYIAEGRPISAGKMSLDELKLATSNMVNTTIGGSRLALQDGHSVGISNAAVPILLAQQVAGAPVTLSPELRLTRTKMDTVEYFHGIPGGELFIGKKVKWTGGAGLTAGVAHFGSMSDPVFFGKSATATGSIDVTNDVGMRIRAHKLHDDNWDGVKSEEYPSMEARLGTWKQMTEFLMDQAGQGPQSKEELWNKLVDTFFDYDEVSLHWQDHEGLAVKGKATVAAGVSVGAFHKQGTSVYSNYGRIGAMAFTSYERTPFLHVTKVDSTGKFKQVAFQIGFSGQAASGGYLGFAPPSVLYQNTHGDDNQVRRVGELPTALSAGVTYGDTGKTAKFGAFFAPDGRLQPEYAVIDVTYRDFDTYKASIEQNRNAWEQIQGKDHVDTFLAQTERDAQPNHAFTERWLVKRSVVKQIDALMAEARLVEAEVPHEGEHDQRKRLQQIEKEVTELLQDPKNREPLAIWTIESNSSDRAIGVDYGLRMQAQTSVTGDLLVDLKSGDWAKKQGLAHENRVSAPTFEKLAPIWNEVDQLYREVTEDVVSSEMSDGEKAKILDGLRKHRDELVPQWASMTRRDPSEIKAWELAKLGAGLRLLRKQLDSATDKVNAKFVDALNYWSEGNGEDFDTQSSASGESMPAEPEPSGESTSSDEESRSQVGRHPAMPSRTPESDRSSASIPSLEMTSPPDSPRASRPAGAEATRTPDSPSGTARTPPSAFSGLSRSPPHRR